MKTGLFLLIDKNSEYDTRKYYDTAQLRSEKRINNILHHYVKLEDTTKIKIYFHTISIALKLLRTERSTCIILSAE